MLPPDPNKEPQPPSGVIPVLQRETIEQLRKELNLDYYQSAVKTGEYPNALISELAFNTFDKINSMGGNGLFKHYLIY